MSNDIAIRVDHVSKEYRLGMIGGTTLRADLQRLGAKILHKEDPTVKIGVDQSRVGERFLALNDVSFEVEKGEALGIIGHNGAGKSTLLKLLARVTAPTKGTISYNGRIASMLEVGTGFHPELTGRENIYMNGAILGMRKAEIDRKLDEIVAFAEMEKFIDTPVKRYSSGMYVKLAFAVAAHLDAEIMIMDEVLAVGDANFQDKCLEKMGFEAANGKTVLYVSHNMNTIKRLCQRCLMLKKGHMEYDGEPSEAIRLYRGAPEGLVERDLSTLERTKDFANHEITLKHIALTNTRSGKIETGEDLSGFIDFTSETAYWNLSINLLIRTGDGNTITKSESVNTIKCIANKNNHINFTLSTHRLVPGKYTLSIFISQRNKMGSWRVLDSLGNVVSFIVSKGADFNGNAPWDVAYWGNFINDPLLIENR